MTSLIALTGPAGSGKDEVGRILVEQFAFTRVAFADPMRRALYALNPAIPYAEDSTGWARLATIVDEEGWDIAKRKYPEIRALLQRFGTEVGRAQFGEDFWVERALTAHPYHRPVVITDCRYPDEATAVRWVGGEVWRIVRPGVGPVNGHVSDAGLPDELVDRVLLNDGTLSDLAYAVFGAMSE